MSRKDAERRAKKNIAYWQEYLDGLKNVGKMRLVSMKLPNKVTVNAHIARFLKWDVTLHVLSLRGESKRLNKDTSIVGKSPTTLTINPKTGKGRVPYSFLARAEITELKPEDVALMLEDTYKSPFLQAILKGEKPPRWWK